MRGDNLMNGVNEQCHESYGVLGISRVSSSKGVNLFGSSVRPHNTIVLKISTAKRRRDFQKDWITDDKTMVEVEMSPSQFAEAITTLNIGCGTPVTIRYVTGDAKNHRSECPDENFRKIAQSELTAEMAELGQKMENLSKNTKELLKGSGVLKKADREQILRDIQQLEQEVRSNIPYVHTCFNSAVSKTMTEAKSELDATVNHIKMSLGEKALATLQHGGGVDVPLLEGGSVEVDAEVVNHSEDEAQKEKPSGYPFGR